jgi:predicted nucleic acid-binding protein
VPKTLIINDANVLIDIEVSGLTNLVFELEYRFAVADILYQEEIKPYTSEFKGTGLEAIAFDEETNRLLLEKIELYKGTALSRNDISAMVLALSNECILLTGEKLLRATAEDEGLEVHGILWLIEELFNNDLISLEEAEVAYKKMEEEGSRLPSKEIEKQIKRFKKK